MERNPVGPGIEEVQEKPAAPGRQPGKIQIESRNIWVGGNSCMSFALPARGFQLQSGPQSIYQVFVRGDELHLDRSCASEALEAISKIGSMFGVQALNVFGP